MSSSEDYNNKLAEIIAVPDDQLKSIGIPVQVYVQEAEDLYDWCQADQAELTAHGLLWDRVVDLPVRAGALREAESLWNLDRQTSDDNAKLWAVQSVEGFQLKSDLLKTFRYAFRNDAALLAKVRKIADGGSHSDMIQDLNNIAKLGMDNSAALTVINFDLTRLDLAAQKADELGTLLAATNSERDRYRESKKIRDQAYFFLKELVDEIRELGKYVFRDDENRRKGYYSRYLKNLRKKASSATEPEPEPVSVEVPVEVPLAAVN